ncbi:MaoC/PaaZ C-terminal domain-containing protein [Rhodococcus sp. IEGM 1409]|uniref:MaoC/PaaZ C-terminal domain-containing protein n=1 Tax=Rhodococcus sp. IEGM 1409 TaxID=3047082 RepID=UPI0024B7C598|nr:MaoC/PaaZ C-terminal domain-containing protein [Rhodococcus sp. IEGM 1409]MDI9903851.1 MaoC/PaaZ C-terminal domain-containing protein [Rhodococcus sp. IEGM 1409]
MDRAKESPLGGTIAHGNYTLSLGLKFSYAMFSLEGFAFALNCGFDKVGLPAPLPGGSRVRMRAYH